VVSIAGDLANVIDMIQDPLQLKTDAFRRGFAPHPSGDHHPCVQHGAYDRATLQKRFDLLVAELAIMRHERPTVRMTGPKRPVKVVQRLPKTVITQVGNIQD
jgi:hypothetical protein